MNKIKKQPSIITQEPFVLYQPIILTCCEKIIIVVITRENTHQQKMKDYKLGGKPCLLIRLIMVTLNLFSTIFCLYMIKVSAPICFQNESRNWGLPNLPTFFLIFPPHRHMHRCRYTIFSHKHCMLLGSDGQERWQFKCCPKQSCYDLRPRVIGNLLPQAESLLLLCMAFAVSFLLNTAPLFTSLLPCSTVIEMIDCGIFLFITCAVSRAHHFRGPGCLPCCQSLSIFSSQQLFRELFK